MSKIPPTRDAFRVFRTLTTRWFDNDVYAHMNNAVHYQLFDTVVNGHLLEKGVLDIKNSDSIFLVVESGCAYFGEIAFPDVISAGLRVAKLGRSSVKMELGLFRNDDDTAAAEGFFVHVYVDREDHRPTDIPAATRAALEGLLDG